MEEKSIYFIFNIVPQFTLFEYLNCWLISLELTRQNLKKRQTKKRGIKLGVPM